MARYFGTFVPGAGALVEELLAARLGEAGVEMRFENGAVFSTPVPYSDLNLFCFNNLFAVLWTAPGTDLEGFLRELPRAPADWDQAAQHPKKSRTFRVVTVREGRLSAVPDRVLKPLEERIAGVSGLRVDRARPDSEYWVFARREGVCLFCRRLTRHRAYDKLLRPGQLHPEVAYLLCALSAPRPDDRVADPFCGWGAIPLERAKRFPFARLYAWDQDPGAVAATAALLGRKDPRITVARGDARALPLDAGSLDAWITDPPWGLYGERAEPIEALYRPMLREADRVLAQGGRLAVLTAQKEALTGWVAREPRLQVVRQLDLLVSGKKAGAFLIGKMG